MDGLMQQIAKANLSETLYYSFFAGGFIVAVAFLIWYSNKIKLKAVTVVIAVLLGSTAVLGIMELSRRLLSPLEDIIPIMNSYLNNMGRTFIWVPLVAWPVAKIVRTSWTKICSLYSFSQTIIWGIASLGCLFAGCCKGYPFKWGIYNIMDQMRRFPTQLINSIALLCVAGYIFTRCRRRAYNLDGKEYPITIILVGMIRFLTEFIMDNEKIVLGLSSLSFDAIVMSIVGGILYIVIGKVNDRKRMLRVLE